MKLQRDVIDDDCNDSGDDECDEKKLHVGINCIER